jgi:hypothetical protein
LLSSLLPSPLKSLTSVSAADVPGRIAYLSSSAPFQTSTSN